MSDLIKHALEVAEGIEKDPSRDFGRPSNGVLAKGFLNLKQALAQCNAEKAEALEALRCANLLIADQATKNDKDLGDSVAREAVLIEAVDYAETAFKASPLNGHDYSAKKMTKALANPSKEAERLLRIKAKVEGVEEQVLEFAMVMQKQLTRNQERGDWKTWPRAATDMPERVKTNLVDYEAVHMYYGMMGWDRETGVPTREKLWELDIAWAEAYLPA